MALDIDREYQRHLSGWKGFTLFIMLAGGAVVIALGLMAIFLL